MRQYGLIGQSLGHSFSKSYFNNKFSNLGVDADYSNIECETINDVKVVLEKKAFAGFNITIPYKTAIIPLLDKVSKAAMAIGAVNTIKLEGDKWVGYNTDVFGFKQMIKPFFKSHHERAIIFGTGGASKAVAYVLEELGADLIYISRTLSNDVTFQYEDINQIMLNSCYLLVNTTPVGMFPDVDKELTIPYQFLTPKHLVVDLIYNPEETKLLAEAKKRDAWVLNGKTMLHQQAEKAWEIWSE